MATKDELRDLFQERFHGHEAPVDPGMWSAISGQLATSAAASSALEGLFRDRFSGHEADVDPGIWDAINGQLGHGAAAGGGAAAGWGAVAGWAAAGIAVLVMVGGAVWMSQDNEIPSAREVVETEIAVPAPAPEPEVIAKDPITGPVKEMGTSVVATPDARITPAQNPPTGIAVVEQVVSTMTAEMEQEPLKPATVPDPLLEEEEVPVQAPANFGYDPPAANQPQTPAVLDNDPEDRGDQPPAVVAVDPNETPQDVEPAMPFHLFLPNVFTPNHDNYNDDYLPLGEGIESAIIRVYSLTGNELVFRANALVPWDGTNMFTGQACPEGHYLYAIEAIGADGQAHTEGQTVRLLREVR